jgi:hypothetical protein
MKKKTTQTLKAFSIELVIYSILVVGYFFLVLHFLGEWLPPLFEHHKYTYGIVAVILILVQAVALEILTSFLLRLLQGRSE